MFRYIIAFIAAVALATTALAQDEQEVRTFVDELAQDFARDTDAYMDRLSFPVQVSVVTENGEVLSGTFEENEFKLLGRMPGDEIRLHSAQQALMRQAEQLYGQRAAADVGDDADEEMDREEMIVEEELALMPRERIAEEARIHTTDTQVQFINDNVAFVRTTLTVGEEEPEPIAAAQDVGAEEMEDDALAEDEEPIVEEELALRPERRQATMDVGALLVREEGEWRVKSIITGETHLYDHQE